MDKVSKEKRSFIMRQVKSRNTAPELKVRSIAHKLGFRFRLHRKNLPGKPDIVFPSKKKVIFVHGCFWHGHSCKRGSRMPKDNNYYWEQKIGNNVKRDKQHINDLKDYGWDVLVLWECEINDVDALRNALISFLK